VIPMYSPLFHAFGFIHGAMMSLVRGAFQVLTQTLDGDECVDLIARERATNIHGFDTHYMTLRDAKRRTRATCRACARASAAPAWPVPFPLRAGPARHSAI
jgi:acyl-CoA synthetase (AMP-forming)/AMP-acid ligase II